MVMAMCPGAGRHAMKQRCAGLAAALALGWPGALPAQVGSGDLAVTATRFYRAEVGTTVEGFCRVPFTLVERVQGGADAFGIGAEGRRTLGRLEETQATAGAGADEQQIAAQRQCAGSMNSAVWRVRATSRNPSAASCDNRSSNTVWSPDMAGGPTSRRTSVRTPPIPSANATDGASTQMVATSAPIHSTATTTDDSNTPRWYARARRK